MILKLITLLISLAILAVLIGGPSYFLALWVMEPVFNYYGTMPNINVTDPKNYFVVDKYDQEFLNPSPKVDISIVVPVYDEEKRMKPTIDAMIDYLEDWCSYRDWVYEIIIVDDGSRDTTGEISLRYFERYPAEVRVVTLFRNVGKGGAVKLGVTHAYGRYILMADADGATDISELDNLFMWMDHMEMEADYLVHKEEAGIVMGSRAHLATKSIAQRKWYRTVLMKGFHLLVMMFCTTQIEDTQCGFKLFTKNVAKRLFDNLHLAGWAFDIELIFQAQKLGIPMKEVPVKWQEVPGSKLIVRNTDIVTTALEMARDIIAVRLAYLLGYWELPQSKQKFFTKFDEL